MILELSIENFILIDRQIIPFSKGFNIITGETGAGKSMVLGALEIIFGGKVDKSVIKKGSSSATITCAIDIEKMESIKTILDNSLVQYDDDIITISKEIKAEGKAMTRINGKIVASSILKEMSSFIIEITSQNDHYELLTQYNQLNLLDIYIGKDIENIKVIVSDLYYESLDAIRQLSAIDIPEEELNRKLDILDYQINEIENAKLIDGEDEILETRYALLKNYQTVFEKIANILELLDDNGGILQKVSSAIKDFTTISDYLKETVSAKESLETIYYDIEAISDQTKMISRNIEFDENEANEIELRLDLINSLKRKYGKSYELINDSLAGLKKEYLEYSEFTTKREELNAKKEVLMAKYLEASNGLSTLRKKGAENFSMDIQNQLKDLNFKNSRFDINVMNSGKISGNGTDSVQFNISLNLGQDLNSIEKAASGGELSRIMLAIKTVLGDRNNIPITVFDEVDAGISGLTATTVANKLKTLSKFSQIIAITHLPQIAAFGDHHLLVEKFENKEMNTTLASIRSLGDQERISEIARIIAGGLSSDKALESARQMIESVKGFS